MDVFTLSISNWRVAKATDVLIIDTTIKSKHPLFSPSWDIVMGHKNGSVSDEEYKHEYRRILNRRIVETPDRFHEFFMLHQADRIALACYCPAGKFCHRHLLANAAGGYVPHLCQHFNIPYTFYGELQ